MAKWPDIVKRWLEMRAAEQRIIDGTATIHDVLGELAGVPPDAFPIVEQHQAIKVLAAKINRYWNSLQVKDRPPHMTMSQFQAIFRGDRASPWLLGNALREAGWTSSRRRWKEDGARCRLWIPPTMKVPTSDT